MAERMNSMMDVPARQQKQKLQVDTNATEEVGIDEAQGNAIYSSLLELQSTLDNFKLDSKKIQCVRSFPKR